MEDEGGRKIGGKKVIHDVNPSSLSGTIYLIFYSYHYPILYIKKSQPSGFPFGEGQTWPWQQVPSSSTLHPTSSYRLSSPKLGEETYFLRGFR